MLLTVQSKLQHRSVDIHILRRLRPVSLAAVPVHPLELAQGLFQPEREHAPAARDKVRFLYLIPVANRHSLLSEWDHKSFNGRHTALMILILEPPGEDALVLDHDAVQPIVQVVHVVEQLPQLRCP